MIPPASKSQRISAGRHLPSSRRGARAPGRSEPSWAGSCRRRNRRPRCRSPGRPGRTRASRSWRAAPAEAGDLEDDQAAAWFQDPRHFGEAAAEIGQIARAEPDRHRVEAPIAVGQLERVRPAELDRQALLTALRRARSSIGSEKSQPTTRPSGPIRLRSSRARSPVPQQTSRASDPGRLCARSTARWRHWW